MVGVDGVLVSMRAIILLLTLVSGPSGETGFVVITSPATPMDSVTPFRLKQIYLGRLDRLKGMHLKPLHLKSGDPTRTNFERQILGDRADLEDYWLQQKLKAGARPPSEVSDWVLVVAYVKRNPGFVGYIPAEFAEDARKRGVKLVTVSR